MVEIRDAIDQTLIDAPPVLARDGAYIRDEVDAEIDDLRHVSRSGKQVIAEMEAGERARTGIASLKVRYNRVFGYYSEISKSNLHAVPADYVRKQTIAGGERYVTPALKEYEQKVLGVDERILEREVALFEALRAQGTAEAPRIQDTARAGVARHARVTATGPRPVRRRSRRRRAPGSASPRSREGIDVGKRSAVGDRQHQQISRQPLRVGTSGVPSLGAYHGAVHHERLASGPGGRIQRDDEHGRIVTHVASATPVDRLIFLFWCDLPCHRPELPLLTVTQQVVMGRRGRASVQFFFAYGCGELLGHPADDSKPINLRYTAATIMGIVMPVMVVEMNDTEPQASESGYTDQVSRLTWVTGTFDVRADRAASPGAPGQSVAENAETFWPGPLVHAVLGKGVREIGCEQRPACKSSCERPEACLYGRLFEPRPAPSEQMPLKGVARLPGPVVIDAPWSRWNDDAGGRFHIHLLGRAAMFRGGVTDGLERGLLGGVGRHRRPWRIAESTWCMGRHEGTRPPPSLSWPASSVDEGLRLLLTFQSPLRLVRAHRELREFDAVALVRDLQFRLAVWGHYHEGLPWPPVWGFLREQAARVTESNNTLEWRNAHRYSGRQGRVVPLGGLMGQVQLSNVSPAMLLLLQTGTVCGVGKGASVGLGRMRVKLLTAA